jgi:HD-GYP domain-containing protein (c-di-GMP phosphodiesterase class II)
MKKHPKYGWAVLRILPGFRRPVLDILHHHKSFDGQGYPAALRATEIPTVSRIVSVIDAFDCHGFPHARVATACPRGGDPPLGSSRRHAI